MRIIIAGGRDFSDYEFLRTKVTEYLTNNPQLKSEITIVSGCARGADSLGIRYASEYDIVTKLYPADWLNHGKSAGYKRNQLMAENADVLIAFWDGKSRGTMHMIDIAQKKGLEVLVFPYS